MKKARWVLAATALFGMITLTGLAQKAPNLNGTWVGKTDVPGVGAIEVTLVLKKAENSFSGTISSDNQAVVSPNTEIRDVTTDGEKFSFVFPLTDGSLLLMKFIIAEDKMTGYWEHPAGTTAPAELVKKK